MPPRISKRHHGTVIVTSELINASASASAIRGFLNATNDSVKDRLFLQYCISRKPYFKKIIRCSVNAIRNFHCRLRKDK